MRKITAIEAQKNRNRVSIHLDGEFAFGLDRLIAAWLKPGDMLSDEKISQLQTDDARERAYQQVMLFLSFRDRSEKEIRQNLRKHEIPDEVIDQTLERLRGAGLANDEKFARAWVENRSTFRPRGRRALTMELRRKGLPDEAVRAAVANVDDEALAYESGIKRAARFSGLEWTDFRKKLSDYLMRRGFSYEVIAPTVSKIWKETHAVEKLHELEDMK